MVEPVQEPDDALVLVGVADVELVVVGGGAEREEELAGDERPHLLQSVSRRTRQREQVEHSARQALRR